jgi:putative DNA primase/helicase
VVAAPVNIAVTAGQMMAARTFKTVCDVRGTLNKSDVLCYEPSSGLYLWNGNILIEQMAQQILGKDATNYIVSEIAGFIKRSTIINRSEIDDRSDYLPLENGVLEFSTGKLLPHSPNLIFTSQLPVSYDPLCDCPKFKSLLGRMFSRDNEEVFKEYLGFLLTPGYQIHKVLILVGPSGCGKTTLMNIIGDFIGQGNIAAIPLQELCGSDWAKADLYGKYANLADEMPSDPVEYGTELKQVTGESRIRGQQKYKNPFEFINQAKLIFACNELPMVKQADDAFYGRWIIIEPNLFRDGEVKLQYWKEISISSELSGILNLALEYRKKILYRKTFSYFSDAKSLREIYERLTGDNEAKFINECLDIDSETVTKKIDIFQEYVSWCKHCGRIYKGENTFHRKLQSILGDRIIETRPWVEGIKTYCYRGIKIHINGHSPSSDDSFSSESSDADTNASDSFSSGDCRTVTEEQWEAMENEGATIIDGFVVF